MQVNLYEYTGSGHPDPADYAAGLLIFTKRTRLQMTPGLLAETMALSPEVKLKELEYMAATIPSSWEFVQYSFLIQDVTRAFSHQFVRTRHASFAQQTMRILDVSSGPGWTYGTGPTIEANSALKSDYDDTMEEIAGEYKHLIASGAAIEDARGILPTNIHTSLCVTLNMRTFVEMVRKRSTPRVQSEYRSVLDGMKNAVRAVHPWIDLFIERDFDKIAKEMLHLIEGSSLTKEEKTTLFKGVDALLSQS